MGQIRRKRPAGGRTRKTAVKGRVTGLGGVFFKASDPGKLGQWYRDHLGLEISEWGGAVFEWRHAGAPRVRGTTAWSLFPRKTKHFGTGRASFMINYRVDDLDRILKALRRAGCQVDPRVEDSEFGRFGWAFDPEGNRIELWEPAAGR